MTAQPGGQEEDDGAVAPGQSWSFGLAFEDDDLLAQQGVFQDQFRLGAIQVQGSVEGQGMAIRLCPPAKG
jgi:hypothetical protein